MAKRTVGEILDRAADHLGDFQRDVFKRSKLLEPFKDAWEILYDHMRDAQLEDIELITTYTLPGGTTELDPATASITSLGQLDRIEERPGGSSEYYIEMNQVEELPQRGQYANRLVEFEYRNEYIYVVGATSSVDLQITYKASGEAPEGHGTTIARDNAQRFLAFQTAAIAGPPNRRIKQGEWCERQADQALQLLIRPKVRDHQNKEQLQAPAYDAGQTTGRRRGGRPPYFK